MPPIPPENTGPAAGTPAVAAKSGVPWYLLGVLFVMFLGFGGVRLIRHFLPGAVSRLPGGASGTITTAGTPENWTMHVSSCYAGERHNYFGASFFDDRQNKLGGHINLAEDQPARVVLDTPTQGGSVVLTKDQCDVWDVELHHTSSTYNGIWAVTGHARFDCSFDNPAAHFTGDIQLHSCH